MASAKRESKPDFELGYMYQNTDRKYRDYYVFTFDVRFPRKKRVNAEIAEAQEHLSALQRTLDPHLQQQLAQAQQNYVQATNDGELLRDYREGLIPQSDAAYRAALTAYGSNREEFVHIVTYFTDVLNLKLEYASTLEDHEIALAHRIADRSDSAMNKYVIRTSIVWLAVIAAFAGTLASTGQENTSLNSVPRSAFA